MYTTKYLITGDSVTKSTRKVKGVKNTGSTITRKPIGKKVLCINAFLTQITILGSARHGDMGMFSGKPLSPLKNTTQKCN